MSEVIHCPTCGSKANRGDFLCPSCETILDAEQLMEDFEPPREPTVIRALLSPPEASLKKSNPEAPPELRALATAKRGTTKTKLFTLPFESVDIPVVAIGLDLKAQSLSSFEAFIVSQVDGQSTVDQLRHVTMLSRIEIQSVLRSLVDRHVLEMKAPAPPPPKPRKPIREIQAPRIVEAPERKAAPVPALAPEPPRMPAPVPVSMRSAPAPRKAAEHVYEAPLQKAIRLELEGNLREAIAVLERAIEVSPDPAALYNRLALALIKERRDIVGAEAMLQKALEYDPTNDVYTKNLMKVLAMAGAVTNKKKRPKR